MGTFIYDIFFEENSEPAACFFNQHVLGIFLEGMLRSNYYPQNVQFAITIDDQQSPDGDWYVATHRGRYQRDGASIEVIEEHGLVVGLMQELGLVHGK